MGTLKSIDPVDGFWMLGCIIWLALTITAAGGGDGDMFQRLGALLVAIVGAYYLMVPHVQQLPIGQIESDALASKQTKLTSDMVALAHERIALIASELKADIVARGQAVPIHISKIASIVEMESFKEIDLNGLEKVAETADAVAIQRFDAETQITKVNLTRSRTQAVMLSVGTIQWGFGDLLFGGGCLC